MNPGLVSSSTTVGFVSTDVLGSTSLTLTLDNVTGSVVAASWCGAASLSTTRTPLYMVDGNLTGIRYLNEIIRPLVLPGLQQIGGGAVLQDDNARPHRAMVVTDFLRQQRIARMDWPAYSPDLAPIEHAWDELGRRVRNNHAPPANLHDMGQLLMAEWQAIPQEF